MRERREDDRSSDASLRAASSSSPRGSRLKRTVPERRTGSWATWRRDRVQVSTRPDRAEEARSRADHGDGGAQGGEVDLADVLPVLMRYPTSLVNLSPSLHSAPGTSLTMMILPVEGTIRRRASAIELLPAARRRSRLVSAEHLKYGGNRGRNSHLRFCQRRRPFPPIQWIRRRPRVRASCHSSTAR